jgi:hypothetical protein
VTKKHAVLPSNLHSIVIMNKHITQCLLGQDSDYNASLRVVRAALRMQKSHLQKLQRVGKEKAKYIEKPRIRDTICDLLHIGHDAYSAIVGGYLHDCRVYVSGKNGAEGGSWQFYCKGDSDPSNNGNADCGPRCWSRPSDESPESYWMPSP